jgi:hypothetical protein
LTTFVFVATFLDVFLATARAGLFRSFVALVLVAFFARALPAGERLVAGFRRVDFATALLEVDDLVPARRPTERDEGFFTDFAMGLLTSKPN